MKKLGVLLLTMLLMISCQKKSGIEIITENVPDKTKVDICIRELGKDEPSVIASGVITGGKLTLENPFKEADEAFLVIKESEDKEEKVTFVGEPGMITINFDKKNPDNYTLKGTENNEQLQKLVVEVRPLTVKFKDFMEVKGARMMALAESGDMNSEELKKLQEEYQALSKETVKLLEKHESANRGKAVGIMMLSELVSSQEKTLEEYQADFEKYPEAIRNSKLGKKFTDLMKAFTEDAIVSNIKIGEKLPEFKALTPDDKEVTLSSFLQGKKLVLVDVWASWCGPCRQENPNVVKAYEAFKSKGFEVIGYSLDKDATAWKKAIGDDKLTWTQVSNLQFWKDPIVADYGIKGVPANFLVDANGIVVAMDLRGEDLTKKIEEFLK